MSDELSNEVRAIYRETRAFYEERLEPREFGLGYKILYGPPIHRPRLLFVGYQPGGGRHDCEREIAAGAHDGWPEILEYAVKDWPLAKSLQTMLGVETLRSCMGMNALFFRAPSASVYRQKVSRNIRSEIEEFCLPRVERMARILQPEKIVAIGFETLALFGRGTAVLTSDKGRVLTREGIIVGTKAIGVLHLTGSRISKGDRELIAQQFSKD